jgi:hypothetical protein
LTKVKRLANIALRQFKAGFGAQVPQILGFSREQIVHCQHGVPLRQQGVAEMRTQKSGAPGHQYA